MHILPVVDPAELVEVHARLLVPAFPPDELVEPAALVGGVEAGTTEVLVLHGDDRPTAIAVGDRAPGTPVVLLSYLATDAAARSAGLGRRLLDAALTRWSAAHDPCLVLAEVEDPAHHRASAFGDPVARLRFYARYGARALELRYVQPALRPGARRVPAMLLLVLHAAPELCRGPEAVAAAPVREFLEGAFTAGEGGLPTDPEGRRLLAAAAVSDSLALHPLSGSGS